MRIVPLIISAIVTITLVIVLSIPLGTIPPLGSFLSPQHGFWLNAEPVNKSFNENLQFSNLKGKTQVHFDERMVPHIFAEQESDAHFVQGYLHAKFRLWQMEFQTHAAAGRLSEILGVGPDSAILNNDRNMRRLGMVFAARNSLRTIEQDAEIRLSLDSYTAGVNAYIEQMTNKDLPLEYRLLNYTPEKWTNLKSALFLKYMSYDLTGEENDIEFTNARTIFNSYTIEQMYPIVQDGLDPIIPKETSFDTAGVKPIIPITADSIYFARNDSTSIIEQKPDKDNGSNNWAVSGSKTASGRPILCNDPHLGVNLPSLWYEIQITTPDYSVYGVSFPGAPSVVIGFNENIAWGVTNAMRDVRDYYEIQFKEGSNTEYLFNNEYIRADLTIEEYKIKGGVSMFDTVAYTVFGPVMYNRDFNGAGRAPAGKNLAVKWKAHEASNDMKTFYLLNRAKNYDDYLDAIKNFVCPGQNFVFASKTNEIAIWQQGAFPAKWRRQGDYIMPGTDSSYMWQGDIPQTENPHLVNPTRGFVSSANQLPVDSTYPYYIGGFHDLYRGKIINRFLSAMEDITPKDMMALQNENANLLAQELLPVLQKNINRNELNDEQSKYLDLVLNWNKRNDPDEEGATVFKIWMDSLQVAVWKDELKNIPGEFTWPEDYTLAEALIRDSAFQFIDNINTEVKEDIATVITASFISMVPELKKLDQQGKLKWTKYKDSGVRHLLRMEALSRFHLRTGGGRHIINATKQFHAPSWKMIVHLTDEVEAYGIYPGGQSGNPGSRFYDDFVNRWAAGQYHALWFMKPDQQKDNRVRYTMNFSKS